MRQFLKNASVLFCLGFLPMVSPAEADEVRYITEDWPPFNYEIDGKPAGMSVELAQAVQEVLGKPRKIEFMPWNRAYRLALNEPNVLVFSMARTPERENKFRWVESIHERKIFLYKLKKRHDIKVDSIDDARRYKVGANTENDASTRGLLELGFVIGKNVELIHGKDHQNLSKLILGRVDMIVSTDTAMNYEVRKAGLSINDFEATIPLPVSEREKYFFAFSLGTLDSTVAEFQRAFEQIRKNGSYERIKNRYLASFPEDIAVRTVEGRIEPQRREGRKEKRAATAI